MLARRRIDLWLLGLAGIMFPLYLPGPVGLASFFAICGLYVVFSNRRRAWHYAASAYGVVVLYCAWSLSLIILRGEVEPGNRQFGFMLLLFGATFIGPGLCLVRRPLRTLVIGTRIGTCAAFLVALGLLLYHGHDLERYSGGGNAAIVALLVLLGALVATIRLDQPPRFLPNGLQYMALASFPIFLTETRAVLVLVPVLFVAEFFFWSLGWRPRIRNRSYAGMLLGMAVLLFLPPVQDMISDRFYSVYEYYVAGANNYNMESGDIRLTMWVSALAVIKQHPLTGVGLMDMFALMKVEAGSHAGMIEGFKHVHNFVLQELLANGVVGLVLLCAIPTAFLLTVLRQTLHRSIQRCGLYFYGSVAMFGLLHDPFYHELCLATSMLFFGCCMAQFRRWNMLTPAAARKV
ncbi:O-antigen ligase family protein [Rhizobium sp. SL86]|uniref:O-antigen ligase family protein n=1 Tax=Rhizobium sp. SL86 TaxID=2995148 RepID=UPI0022759A9C|nr:O-antigen ligase family protein [Rhizobium sp. SL86]MCY1664366.1 O-antigen ligase family protein [Rhizobium sp. SL86]